MNTPDTIRALIEKLQADAEAERLDWLSDEGFGLAEAEAEAAFDQYCEEASPDWFADDGE